MDTSCDGLHCRVYLPDGTRIVVATAQPLGVEAYVQAVTQFVAWVGLGSRGWDGALAARADAEAEAAHCARSAAMIEWQVARRTEGAGALDGSLHGGAVGMGLPALQVVEWGGAGAGAKSHRGGLQVGGWGGERGGDGGGWGGGMRAGCGSFTQAMVEAALRKNAELAERQWA